MRRALLAMPLLVALGACGSSPKTQFYTLDAVSPTDADPAPVRGSAAHLEVGHVEIPGTLDRLSMVTAKGGDQVEVSDQDRWAAPLDELVRRALTDDLRQRLPAGAVLVPGDPAPPGTRVLTLNVQRFMGDAGGRVVLEADWAVGTDGQHPRLHHARIEETAAAGGGGAVAGAMSRALGRLADQVSASVARG